MATGGTEFNFDDEQDCAVCTENFKDARVLNCGHYFCRGCLERVLRKDPEGSIKCPTCREVTPVIPGSGVKGLKRPILKTKQSEIAGLLFKDTPDIVVYCDTCAEDDTTELAAHLCTTCMKKLCVECAESHGTRTDVHKVVKIVDSLFCSTHNDSMITMACEDCNKDICPHCILEEHADHNTINIADIAEQSRQRLREFITTQSSQQQEAFTLRRVQTQLRNARKLEADVKDTISKVREYMKEMEKKLCEVERETKVKLDAEIKTLVLYESDIKDVVDSKKSLIDHATYLTEEASDPELVDKERSFPKTKDADIRHIEKFIIQLPVVEDTFTRIPTQIQQMIPDCKVTFKKTRIEEKNRNLKKIEDLSKRNVVPVSHVVRGLTIDIARRRLVARTEDAEGPLKVYNYTGELVETLGEEVEGLADSQWRGLAVDSKRDLYMAPWANSLILIDFDGQRVSSLCVGGVSNSGVAYCDDPEDLYLVSESSTNTVYMIDPTTAEVTREFGSQGSGPSQFSGAFNIHVGTVVGIDSICIFVSDFGNHCVQLFDMSGNHLETYGCQGQGDKQLSSPWSVVTDPSERIIVSDHGNNRLVGYWTEGGQERWQCLRGNDWGDRRPWHMTLDPDNMVLAIVDQTYKTLHIYD